MFDLSKEKVAIDCPECNRKIQVTLSQVANGEIVKCSCGAGIKLEDKGGSTKRSIAGMNNSMKKLDEAFKKLGR